MKTTPTPPYTPRPVAPCYQCPDRHVGCHSKCERYKAYAAEVSADREKAAAAYRGQALAESWEIRQQLKRKTKWRRGHE